MMGPDGHDVNMTAGVWLHTRCAGKESTLGRLQSYHVLDVAFKVSEPLSFTGASALVCLPGARLQ